MSRHYDHATRFKMWPTTPTADRTLPIWSVCGNQEPNRPCTTRAPVPTHSRDAEAARMEQGAQNEEEWAQEDRGRCGERGLGGLRGQAGEASQAGSEPRQVDADGRGPWPVGRRCSVA